VAAEQSVKVGIARGDQDALLAHGAKMVRQVFKQLLRVESTDRVLRDALIDVHGRRLDPDQRLYESLFGPQGVQHVFTRQTLEAMQPNKKHVDAVEHDIDPRVDGVYRTNPNYFVVRCLRATLVVVMMTMMMMMIMMMMMVMTTTILMKW
jgi:hypothetical protein